jgi:DNA anti-recombination protein RmuC
MFVLSLQEVHEAVKARLVELEEAMNAELSQLAAAGQAQLAALNRSLGDKMGGIAQLKAQFEELLNAAWEEYGETYAQLASVQEVRGVLGVCVQGSGGPKSVIGGVGRHLRSWQAARS